MHFFVHLDEVVVDELIDDLLRKVNPDVKDASFILVPKGILKVLLNIAHDGVRSTKVKAIPLPIALAVCLTLLADTAVSKQVVDELDRQNIDLFKFLEH